MQLLQINAGLYIQLVRRPQSITEYKDIVIYDKRQSFHLLCCTILSIWSNTSNRVIQINDSLCCSVCLKFGSQDKSQTPSKQISEMRTGRPRTLYVADKTNCSYKKQIQGMFKKPITV
jgi:hypothetical protein